LKKVLVTLLGLFDARELSPPCTPLVPPLHAPSISTSCRKQKIASCKLQATDGGEEGYSVLDERRRPDPDSIAGWYCLGEFKTDAHGVRETPGCV